MIQKLIAKFSNYLFHYRKFGRSGIGLLKNIKRKNNEVFSVKLNEIPFPFFLRSNTSDISAFYQIFSYKQYKIDFGNEPKYIIDLGANIGLSTIYFKYKYPHAVIIAVEPDPSNFELLVRNTKMYQDIHCVQCGVWSSPTNLEVIDIGKGKWAYMTKEVNYVTDSTIKSITIDEIMQLFQIVEIDVLKIDIEGAEKELFETGFENWITKVKTLIIELHDRYKEGCTKTFFRTMGNYEFSSRIRGENIICDFKK